MRWIVARLVPPIVAITPFGALGAERVSVGFSYEANPACADASTFARWVSERAPAVSLEPVGPERAEVTVALRSDDGAFRGTLRIRRADGTDYVREMPGATCDEVGSALAFVAALALRREQYARPAPAPADPTMFANDTAPTSSAPPASVGARWKWGVSGGLGIRFGLAPTWANTEEIHLEAGFASRSSFAPVLRLGVIHAEPVTRIDWFGAATFTWTSARAAVCPWRATLLSRLKLRPCVGMDLGIIGASGAPSTPRGVGKEERAAWADAFSALRVEFQVAEWLSAIAEAELAVPLTQYEFGFDPNTPVYTVPAVAGAAMTGLSVKIP